MLQAYQSGLFPMEVAPQVVGWFSPDPRGVIPVGSVHQARSMGRFLRRYSVTVDQYFEAVVRACADPNRQGYWITDELIDSYLALHATGIAHSVEVFAGTELVGGLFGIEIGGLFAGESMFHSQTNASKVALIHTDRILAAGDQPGSRLFDVQWWTPHLGSMGAQEVARQEYLPRLERALKLRPAFGPGPNAAIPADSTRS